MTLPSNESATLLLQCTSVLDSRSSSTEQRVASLCVGVLAARRSDEASSAASSLVAAATSPRNLKLLRRMVATPSLRKVALDVLVLALPAVFVESLAAPIANILTDSSVSNDDKIQAFTILNNCLAEKSAVLHLMHPQVIDPILASFDSTDPTTTESTIAFINHLITALHALLPLPLSEFSTKERSSILPALTHLLTHLSHTFNNSTTTLKFESMRLLFPCILLSQQLDHPETRVSWGPDVHAGLMSVLQSKLNSSDRDSALLLASAAFQHVGPTWLFPITSEPTTTSESQEPTQHQKFATLLIHLTCTDLRVRLDETAVAMDALSLNNSESKETSTTTVTASTSNEAFLISHLNLLSNAIQTLVQTFSVDDEPDSPSEQQQQQQQPHFPSNLLISLHHALAESFIAVLAHLVDLYESHLASRSTSPFMETSPVVPHAVSALGVWLAEDSEAVGTREVRCGMGVLVAVVREMRGDGVKELGGCFVNVCGEEDVDFSATTRNAARVTEVTEDGEEEEEVGGESGGRTKARFLECGGGRVVGEWVMETGRGEEERRVGVCCLLNLVVSSSKGGAKVLRECGGEGEGVGEVAGRVVGRCLEGELKGPVTPDTAIHILNALCLSLFLLRDLPPASTLPTRLTTHLLPTALQTLYRTRLLQRSHPDTWSEVSELWFLSVNALAACVRRDKETARVVAACDDLARLARWCGEFAEGGGGKEEGGLEFDEGSSVVLFCAVQEALMEMKK
ncbi:hypothetical protein HDU98_006869 [Podochytrium sp. JEL0797]|nr:hypothetical protein HDU98_006869 [Podochytrium sp. JEL0797]